MIATRTKPRKVTPRSPKPNNEKIRQFLSQDIPFIPHQEFRRWSARGQELGDDSWAAPGVRRESWEEEPVRVRSTSQYEKLCGVPLLSPAEEKSLFCRMNYLKFQANRLRLKLLRRQVPTSEFPRCQALLSAAYDLRNRIVHANVRLVVSIARQVANPKNSLDELVSEGITCLMKAVDKFDFDRGFRFSTYATRSIRRELWRFIRRNHKLRMRWVTSLDDRLQAEEMPLTQEPPTLDEWLGQGQPERLRHQLAQLDERERFIVDARFGFTNLGRKPTFQTLGKLLGVSKERARQLEQRAMSKLRDGFGLTH